MIRHAIPPLLLSLAGCVGLPPLHQAAMNDDAAAAQRLLDAGADVNARTKSDSTPLHFAGNQAARLLVARGADVNAADADGMTPLMRMASAGWHDSIEGVRFLLAQGADPLARATGGQWRGQTAKDLAAARLNHDEFVTVLEAAEASAKKKAAAAGKKAAALGSLEASATQIQAAEAAGDAARDKAKAREALDRYGDALKLAPPGTEPDRRLREKIIAVAAAMRPPPDVPEESQAFGVRAQVFIKRAQKREDFGRAAAELQKGLLLTPWWGDGYFNLGLAQEKAEDYAGASQSLALYLAATPDARDAKAVRKKIAELGALQEIGESPQ